MRILFSADQHLNLRRKKVKKEWEKDRFEQYLTTMLDLESQADFTVLGGDFFDKMPNLEELAIFLDYVSRVTIETYMLPGNHEATGKTKTFLSQLKETVHSINPLFDIIDEPRIIRNTIALLPYTHLKSFKDSSIFKKRGIPYLATHVRGAIPPHVEPEVDLDIFKDFKRVLAGDLHDYKLCQKNIYYPGSPMTTSRVRANSSGSHGVFILDTVTNNLSWVELYLPQLLRKTVSSAKEMVPDPVHNVVYELEGDIDSLSGVEDSDLLDKKLMSKAYEDKLLDDTESMREEVFKYLKDVLNLKRDQIKGVMSVYNLLALE